MAISIDGSANTIAGITSLPDLAVGGVPDGTIDADALATNAVTNAKVASNAIDSSELVAGAVDLAHLSTTGTAGSANYLRGDNSWQEAGGGKVLQCNVVRQSHQLVLSTEGTWTDLSVSTSITPTSGTTKMLVQGSVAGIHRNSSCNWIGLRVVGTASSMTQWDQIIEKHYGIYSSSGYNSPVQGVMGPVPFVLLHDHNQPNEITYKLQAIIYDHSDDEATFMMWGSGNNQNSPAHLCVMELDY